jgi:hypothetical protein
VRPVRPGGYLPAHPFLTPQFVLVAHLAQPLDPARSLVPSRAWNSIGGALLSVLGAL